MLLLSWLEELELEVVLELLLEPKSDFSRLVRVLVVEESELVVRASPADAVWSAVPSHRTAVTRRVAMQRERDGRDEEEGSCMGWRAFVPVM